MGLPVTYTNNNVFSNLLLKLEVVSLLEISALKEFPSGKWTEIILEHVGFSCRG